MVPGTRPRSGPTPTPAAQRVLARIVIADTGYGTPCWLFQGTLTSAGYGNVGSRRDNQAYFESAHRVVYAAAYGSIEPGLQVDHLCTTRPCVNPCHLEVVTPYENNRRQQMRRFGPVGSWLQADPQHVADPSLKPLPAAKAMRASRLNAR